MKIKEIKTTEYNSYFGRYIDKLSMDMELIEGFESEVTTTLNFFNAIPENKLDYRYAEGKWSCKEVFQHMIDTERIFIHRCFRIARNDKTALTGFDQDIYISPSGASQKTREALFVEYSATRQASIVLLKSLRNEDLQCIGNANGAALSARAAAAMVLGHNIWHTEIIKERYL